MNSARVAPVRPSPNCSTSRLMSANELATPHARLRRRTRGAKLPRCQGPRSRRRGNAGERNLLVADTTQGDSVMKQHWPPLRLDDWTASRQTLHMWLQIVGKVRLIQAPLINHWWQVTFYVSPRGLSTSAIPYGTETFDMEFDFIDHQLFIRNSDGRTRRITLEPKS